MISFNYTSRIQGAVRLLVLLLVLRASLGIPREKRDTLFEKYQESLDVLSQGTGIGLSLCKNLVTLLNGQIFLDEEYDSGIAGLPGAAFVVQLKQPRLPADSVLDETEQTASLQHSDGTPTVTRSTSDSEHRSDLPEKLSVLFVDDDNVLRKLFVRGVRKAAPSWEVAEAASGEAALQLVETDEFDIIFMDQVRCVVCFRFAFSFSYRIRKLSTWRVPKNSCWGPRLCTSFEDAASTAQYADSRPTT